MSARRCFTALRPSIQHSSHISSTEINSSHWSQATCLVQFNTERLTGSDVWQEEGTMTGNQNRDDAERWITTAINCQPSTWRAAVSHPCGAVERKRRKRKQPSGRMSLCRLRDKKQRLTSIWSRRHNVKHCSFTAIYTIYTIIISYIVTFLLFNHRSELLKLSSYFNLTSRSPSLLTNKYFWAHFVQI